MPAMLPPVATPRQLLMGLFNNRVGRQLAMDPANRGRDPEVGVREAIEDGRLRLSPIMLSLEDNSSTFAR
jgi:hypothetical protein